MPYINTKLNVDLPQQKEKAIKEKFGRAISILPGKSETWLMLNFEEKCKLYFRGSINDAAAYVEVSMYGKADGEAYNKLTASITQVLSEELSIAPDHIYVKYEECEYWGFNGKNF